MHKLSPLFCLIVGVRGLGTAGRYTFLPKIFWHRSTSVCRLCSKTSSELGHLSFNSDKIPRLFVGNALHCNPLYITSTRNILTEITSKTKHPTLFARDKIVALTPDQSHYLITVLRQTNRKAWPTYVRLFDGSGEEWLAELLEGDSSINKSRLCSKGSVSAICKTPLKSLQINEVYKSICVLCVAAPKKKDRLRWMIEKTTELGVSGFCWLDTEFSETRSNTMPIFRKLLSYVLEASEQSERLILPYFLNVENHDVDSRRQIRSMHTQSTEFDNPLQLSKLKDFFRSWESSQMENGDAIILACRERSNALPVLRVLEQIQAERINGAVAFLIGPEGGWSPEEHEFMDLLASGFPRHFINVSLGPNILRTETAAVAAVTAFSLCNYANTTILN